VGASVRSPRVGRTPASTRRIGSSWAASVTSSRKP